MVKRRIHIAKSIGSIPITPTKFIEMNPEDIEQQLNFKKDADEIRAIFKVYLDIEKKLLADLQEKRGAEINHYKETIRNFILVNGAIVAFILPLLDNSNIFKVPLILSSIIFLINIIVSYWHLQKGWTKNFKAFISLEDRVIKPIKDMKDLAIEAMRGQKDVEYLRIEDKKFKELGGGYDMIIIELSKILPDAKRLNNIDTVIILLFTLAVLLLIYAIAGSYINILFVYLIKIKI